MGSAYSTKAELIFSRFRLLSAVLVWPGCIRSGSSSSRCWQQNRSLFTVLFFSLPLFLSSFFSLPLSSLASAFPSKVSAAGCTVSAPRVPAAFPPPLICAGVPVISGRGAWPCVGAGLHYGRFVDMYKMHSFALACLAIFK